MLLENEVGKSKQNIAEQYDITEKWVDVNRIGKTTYKQAHNVNIKTKKNDYVGVKVGIVANWWPFDVVWHLEEDIYLTIRSMKFWTCYQRRKGRYVEVNELVWGWWDWKRTNTSIYHETYKPIIIKYK